MSLKFAHSVLHEIWKFRIDPSPFAWTWFQNKCRLGYISHFYLGTLLLGLSEFPALIQLAIKAYDTRFGNDPVNDLLAFRYSPVAILGVIQVQIVISVCLMVRN